MGCMGYFQVTVCAIRFDLLHTPVAYIMSSFETYVPFSLCRFLIAIVSLHHYNLRYLLCPNPICVSIIRYYPSTLRVICRTSTLGSYGDVSFPSSSCFQRSLSQTRYVHLRFACCLDYLEQHRYSISLLETTNKACQLQDHFAT